MQAATICLALGGCAPRDPPEETTDAPAVGGGQSVEAKIKTPITQEPNDGSTYRALKHQQDKLRAVPFEFAAVLRDENAFSAWQKDATRTFMRLLRMDSARSNDTPLRFRKLSSEEHEGYRRDKVDYLVEPGLRIPAYLFVPSGARSASAPAIVAWHGHNEEGKEALTSQGEASYHRAGAVDLAKAGYIVLAPDIRGFGETRSPGSARGKGTWKDHRLMSRIWLLHDQPALGIFLADADKAVEVLKRLPEVDANRIGMTGISLGGQITLYAAATNPDVRVAVVQSYLGSYPTSLYGYLHDTCNYIPALGRSLDISDVGLMVPPKPLLFVQGATDWVFPSKPAREAFDRIASGYRLLGVGEKASLYVQPLKGHEWVSGPAIEWFEAHL